MEPRSPHPPQGSQRPISSSERPLVSVVISAYNIAPYIRAAVESALVQSYDPLEVVVVDDGSTDGTPAKIGDICDDRLRVLQLDHQGISATLNHGIQETRGDLVGFLDGDDLWEPEKVERHVMWHRKRPEVDLTFSLSKVIDEAGTPTGLTLGAPAGTISFRQLLTEYLVRNGSASVIRREALDQTGGFDPDMRACNDVDFCLRVKHLRPGNVYCIPEPLTLYRRRRGQLSADWRRMQECWGRVFDKMERLAPEEFRATRPRANVNLYRYLAFLAYESAEFRSSASLLYRSLRASPWRFFTDSRNLVLSGACLAALALPRPAHLRLDRVFRRRSGTWGVR